MANIISIDGVKVPETPDRKAYVVGTARKLFNLSGRAKLALAACLHEIRDQEYWRDYEESFDQFVYIEFGYKPSTADTLIRIYHTFVETLQKDPENIADIPWARLAMILPHVTSENLDDLLDHARDAETQAELKKYLKDLVGLHITENKTEKGAKFTFTVNSEQADVINEGLKIAEELVGGSPLYPGQIYELIFADFILNNQDDSEDHLHRSIEALERIHNVTLEVKATDVVTV